MPARTVVVCALVCLLIAPSPAPAGPDGDAQLDAATAKFASDKAALRDAASKRIDALAARVLADRSLKPSARQSLKAKWDKEKADFLAADQLSEGSDLADVALDYGLKVSKAYKPVAQRYEQLIEVAQKRGDDQAGKELLAARTAFEAKTLPGARELVGGSVWNGKRTGGTVIPARLAVGAVEGTVGKAVYAQNMQVANHSVVEVRYELDGMVVRGALTGVKQGGMKGLKFEGVVVGTTMVLNVESSDGKKANPGRVILTKAGR